MNILLIIVATGWMLLALPIGAMVIFSTLPSILPVALALVSIGAGAYGFKNPWFILVSVAAMAAAFQFPEKGGYH